MYVLVASPAAWVRQEVSTLEQQRSRRMSHKGEIFKGIPLVRPNTCINQGYVYVLGPSPPNKSGYAARGQVNLRSAPELETHLVVQGQGPILMQNSQ